MPLIRQCEHCQGQGRASLPTDGFRLIGEGRVGYPHLLVDAQGVTVLDGVATDVSLRRARDKRPVWDVDRLDPDIETVLATAMIGDVRIEEVKWERRRINLVPEERR